jgi:hypothetical protein
MGNVVQTNRFTVHVQKERFQLFISEHNDGDFYGKLVYYEKSGDFSAGTREIVFKHQNFAGNCEQDVLRRSKEWIDQNLGNGYSVTSSTRQRDWRLIQFFDKAFLSRKTSFCFSRATTVDCC